MYPSIHLDSISILGITTATTTTIPRQLLYLILLLGSFSVYVWHGWARMPELDLVISQALVLCCLYSFKLACGVSPGRISQGTHTHAVLRYHRAAGFHISPMVTRTHTHTPEEWRRFDNYHYDPVVYEEGKECRTCKVPKYVPRYLTYARL